MGFIKKEFEEVNNYHHNAIACARQKKRKIDKEKEAVDETMGQLQDQQNAVNAMFSK